MSTQLERLGIAVTEGYGAAQLEPAPDVVVIGNALSRGNPAVEAVLDGGLAYTSGPEWLARHVLAEKHVLAVAGTHGKTTTASLLAWMLEHAGLEPGFLIGGVPSNFRSSARLGGGQFFVVEADEYDTAFFDKRAKFVHYRPATLILNNLEYDHADIYDDLDAILWQFHQLMRTVPACGRVLVNGADANLSRVLEMGCWTSVETFGLREEDDWSAHFTDTGQRRFEFDAGGESAAGTWSLGGEHNLENAIGAAAAAACAGVTPQQAADALAAFSGIKRRLEITATVNDIAIYDDFAHHPTAIRRTLDGLRQRYGTRRIVVALEPRSNTMKMGVHNDVLADSLTRADRVLIYRPEDFDTSFDQSFDGADDRIELLSSYDELVQRLLNVLKAGDLMVFMSNGGFGSVRQKLTLALQQDAMSD